MESHERTAQAACGHARFNELLRGAQADQGAEVVGLAGAGFSWGDEAQLFLITQLLLRHIENALELSPGKLIGCAHEQLARRFFPRFLDFFGHRRNGPDRRLLRGSRGLFL